MNTKPIRKTQKQLLVENADLRARLDEADEILSAIRSGQVDALVVSGDDGVKIFTLKQAENALAEAEEKFRKLVESLPSVVYMNQVGEAGAMLYVSPQILAHLGYTQEEWLADPHLWGKSIHPDDYQHVIAEVTDTIRANEKFDMEYRMIARDGRLVWVHDQSLLLYDLLGKPKFRQGIMLDITARKKTEDALQESEAKFRRLVEHLPSVVYLNAVSEASSTIYVSPQIETLMGYTPDEWLADPMLWSQTLHPEDRQQVLARIADTDQSHKPFDMEYRMITRDGSLIWVQDEAVLVNDLKGEPQFWQGIMLDITERKQSESALRESDERFRQVWETTSDAMVLSDSEGIVLAANPAYASLYGYKSEQVVGNSFALIFPEENRKTAVEQYKSVFANQLIPSTFESVIRRADGTERTVETRITFLLAAGQRTAMLSSIRDMTDRKQAEQKIRRQLDYLTALQDIDRTIASTFGMQLSLKVLISKALTLLGVDAAAVLLMNHTMSSLEFVAGDGFRTSAFQTAAIKLAQSYAGRAVMKRHIVKISNLKDDAGNVPLANFLVGEDFVGYYAVPLMLSGKVIGVLEVLQRSLIVRDQEWLDFLNALAGQAAIAIGNAQLFDSLQQSNSELAQAYDATIEGWSQALDLRDKETEGHSLRVTEMTMNLARSFGLSENEMIQVRWGSLLHDIGKMGVPDGILHKPGALTEEEWVLMKKHPRFAYDLLSPIRYLKLALDIPYCHHEKWDGTGYPRGLKGEQIPLSARIFAIVDVWDALRSERPYRAAWPEDKVRDHITALSGTHFDPQVVDVFMKMHDKIDRQ